MAEFHDRLLKQFKRHIMIIGIGLVVILLTNFYMMYETQRSTQISELSVMVANESATKAGKALNQSQINSIHIREHNDIVKKHAQQTLSLKDVFLEDINRTKTNAEKITTMEEILKKLNQTTLQPTLNTTQQINKTIEPVVDLALNNTKQ